MLLHTTRGHKMIVGLFILVTIGAILTPKNVKHCSLDPKCNELK